MTSVLRALGGRFRALPTGPRRALIAAGVVVPATLIMFTAFSRFDAAVAHGSLELPPSRIYYCRFFDNPENPSHPACRAAIAESGKQAVYDWNEVNQPNAGGNHRAVVPDGQLCSGGRTKYRGFDLARSDWPATPMTGGGWYEFRLLGSAAHVGTVELYLTKAGYDPTRPLRWSDLEPTPFLSITRTTYPADYTDSARVPGGRTGRHVIYMVWQRSDSPEAFYACSDVDFGGDGGGGAGVGGAGGGDPTAPVTHDHGETPVAGPPATGPTPTRSAGASTGTSTGTGAHDHHNHEPPAAQSKPTSASTTTTAASGGGSGGGASTAPAWVPGKAYALGRWSPTTAGPTDASRRIPPRWAGSRPTHPLSGSGWSRPLLARLRSGSPTPPTRRVRWSATTAGCTGVGRGTRRCPAGSRRTRRPSGSPCRDAAHRLGLTRLARPGCGLRSEKAYGPHASAAACGPYLCDVWYRRSPNSRGLRLWLRPADVISTPCW